MAMKTIHKQVLDFYSDGVIFEQPKGSEIISVGVQNGKPVLWYKCDVSQPLVKRKMFAIMTGQEFNDEGLTFVGTFQIGGFVGHIFDAGEVVKGWKCPDPFGVMS